MKQKYHVLWSNIAENDLKSILEYIIADDDPSNAIKIFKNLNKKAASLYNFPEKGRIVPELKDQGILSYRELVIPPWRILYRVSENNVYELSVLDSRRNIEDILLKRLTNLQI
jgi:toxin ParE1/3/4